MSSKRGRKRNDNLPPNRARDVQRAFRARRAAHLQALEHRVSELEEENDCLRQALNLPPANRPPLGKGPTGKDKPKSFDGVSPSLGFNSSRDSLSADSPASTSASSLSPSAIAASIPPRPLQVIESGSWDDALMMPEQTDSEDVPDTPYQLTSMSAPLPSKPLQYSPYTGSIPSSSRHSIPSNLYLAAQTNYPHSVDRSVAPSYAAQPYDMRDEPRQSYSYPEPTYHDANMHVQTPPPFQGHPHHSHRESPIPYPPHRRSHTDPHGFSLGQGFPHLPNPNHLQHTSRHPEQTQTRWQDSNGHYHTSHRGAFGPDGRINSMS